MSHEPHSRTLPALSLGLCFLAAACSYTYNPGSGAPGTMTFNTPGLLPAMPGSSPVMPNGAMPSPPGMQAGNTVQTSAPQVASLTRPVSGPYTGVGTVMSDPGGGCNSTVPITNWTVRDDRVSFGVYEGVIQPDGSLRMQGGPTYVDGRFVGSHFTGQYWRPGPSCSYSMTLDPVG